MTTKNVSEQTPLDAQLAQKRQADRLGQRNPGQASEDTGYTRCRRCFGHGINHEGFTCPNCEGTGVSA